ncbi:MAG: hypothetical protein LBN07_00510 [Christensenellaceae bacterium]|jgi:hypothetical protein|nr:hypothetical protein [Christensenellaceae bacterium]
MGAFLGLNKNLRFDAIVGGKYEELVKNMLKRVDAYFEKTGLYNGVDYNEIVEHMKRKLVFEVGYGGSANVLGEHYGDERGGVHIKIRPDKLLPPTPDTEAEKILCHEFIHAITLGNSTITLGGQKYTIAQPGVAMRLGVGGKPQYIRIRDWINNKMLKEGFTEAMARKIYPLSEGEGTYSAQVEMAVGLYELFSEKLGMRSVDGEFLQRNLTSLYGLLGKRADEFDGLCEEFFDGNAVKQDAAHSINGDKYKELQNVVATCWLDDCLKNVNPADRQGSLKVYMQNVIKLASSMQNAENHRGLLEEYNKKFLAEMGIPDSRYASYLNGLQQIVDRGVEISNNFTKIPFATNTIPRIGAREDGGIRIMFNGNIYDVDPGTIDNYSTKDGAISLKKDPLTGFVSATFNDGSTLANGNSAPPDQINMNLDNIQNGQITFEQGGVEVYSNMKAANRAIADMAAYDMDSFAQTL